MSTANTIVLRIGDGTQFEEGVADGAIKPGCAVTFAADGKLDECTHTQAMAVKRECPIAVEDAKQGRTRDTAYASGDNVQVVIPLPGDRLNLLVKSSENVAIGDALVVEGGGSGLFVEAVEAVAEVIPFTRLKVHDAMATDLPAAAANDDMGLITGTPGTDAPTVQGVDFGGTTSDEKAALEYVLPDDYQAGDTITVRCNAGMLTTVADTSCTLDVEAWAATDAGAVGSDLCTTAAQDINSLTFANKDFTITPTGLVAGDKLIIRFSFAGTDSGDAGVMVPEIAKLSIVVDRAVPAQFEATESSGGALAANGFIAARKV